MRIPEKNERCPVVVLRLNRQKSLSHKEVTGSSSKINEPVSYRQSDAKIE